MNGENDSFNNLINTCITYMFSYCYYTIADKNINKNNFEITDNIILTIIAILLFFTIIKMAIIFFYFFF